MLRRSFLLLFLILTTQAFIVRAQRTLFLPDSNLWSVQCLDPLAAQMYGHGAAVWEANVPADYVLANFAIGAQRAVFRWSLPNDQLLELGIEGVALTQFEFTNRNNQFRRSILSTDYLIGIPLVLYRDPWMLRFRVYHLSAHSGDDFLLLNEIVDYYPNNNNYEQFDITLSFPALPKLVIQLGAGSVIRVKTPRKPLYFSCGGEYKYPLDASFTRIIASAYIDSRQDHGFRPAINLGAGVEIGKDPHRALKILVTYFNGPLPYSVYIGEPRQWLGAAFYFNPF